MITPKIKNLFQFIEFLHSNIDRFNQYNSLIEKLNALKTEKKGLKPNQNYKDKMKYDEVQAEIETGSRVLQDNTVKPIKNKAKELNVCDFGNTAITNFNGAETEIQQLKKDFSKDDLPKILRYKTQYIEYRANTHRTFLSLEMFFNDLDELLNDFFGYFKDTEQNDFEAFETKVTQANDIGEAVKLLQQGHTVAFPLDSLNPSTIQQQTTIEPLPPQQIDKEKTVKYIANEYALAYIFDLYAKGNKVPTNTIEGGYNAKEIKRIGKEQFSFDKPDTFYRAVRSVLEKYDLNSRTDLQNISKRWFDAVRGLSSNWIETEQYLKDKKMIEE